MKIYLIRHGESEWNRERRFQGSLDPGLSALGRDQARLTARRCRSLDIRSLYSSPLLRARNTAEIIAAELGLELQIRPNLAECRFGSLQGRTYREVTDQYPEFRRLWRSDPEALGIAGFEPLDEFRARVEGEFRAVVQQNSSGAPAGIVAHGAVIAALLSGILDYDIKRLTRVIASNASLTLVEREETWFLLKYFNDTSHLAG